MNSQLVYVSSVKQMDEAVAKYTDLFLRCPVSHFGTLEWDKWAEIEAAAEPYVQEKIKEWKKQLIAGGDDRTVTWRQPQRKGEGQPASLLNSRQRRQRARSVDNLTNLHSNR